MIENAGFVREKGECHVLFEASLRTKQDHVAGGHEKGTFHADVGT